MKKSLTASQAKQAQREQQKKELEFQVNQQALKEKQLAEAKRQRKILREEVLPVLFDNCENIMDAGIFMNTLANVIRQSFTQLMGKMRIVDLKIEDVLIEDEKTEFWKKMLSIIGQETITSATVMIEGFPRLIEIIVQNENKNRPLSDIKSQLVDEFTEKDEN